MVPQPRAFTHIQRIVYTGSAGGDSAVTGVLLVVVLTPLCAVDLGLGDRPLASRGGATLKGLA